MESKQTERNEARAFRRSWHRPRRYGYTDEQLKAEEAARAELETYVARSTKSSLQGRLLDVLRSDAPDRIIHLALLRYTGYTRGLKVLAALAERENARLFKEVPLAEDRFCWGYGGEILTSIFWATGRMNTQASHSQLLRFMAEKYHPLIRAEATQGMAWERSVFDRDLAIAIVTSPCYPIYMRYEAMYAMSQHSELYGAKEYVLAIRPYLYDVDHNVRSDAMRWLIYCKAGIRILREFLAELEADVANIEARALDIRNARECLGLVS